MNWRSCIYVFLRVRYRDNKKKPPCERNKKEYGSIEWPDLVNNKPVVAKTKLRVVISGFHRALLQSITFTSRLNALDYTKHRS